MKWIIEYDNGIINEHDFSFKSNVYKIYFTDGKNQYGFYYKTGKFFINNTIFDFKIKIDNYELIPFQHKTAALFFDPIKKENSIVAWHIGYDLINNDDKFNYRMSISKNNSVIFKATHYKNGAVEERQIKLQ